MTFNLQRVLQDNIRPAEGDWLMLGQQFVLTDGTDVILTDVTLWHHTSARLSIVLSVSRRRSLAVSRANCLLRFAAAP